jgi:hypothetical protein
MTVTDKLLQLRRQLMFLHGAYGKRYFYAAIAPDDYDELKRHLESMTNVLRVSDDGMRPKEECFMFEGVWVLRYPIGDGAFSCPHLFGVLGEDFLRMTTILEPPPPKFHGPFGLFDELAQAATNWNYTHGARA